MHRFLSDHLETVCPSCRSNHSKKWRSEWWVHEHYKTTRCDCGYKITIKTSSMNSGH